MKYLLFLTLFFVFIQSSISQDTQEKPATFFFSFSPQHILINGTRVEFEKRLKASSHAIVLSPTLYLGKIGDNSILNTNFREYELNGFGIEATHKIYADKSWSRDVNWYQSYSLMYNRYVFDYRGVDWFPFPEDPTLLNLGEKDQQLKIDQFGLSTVIGAVISIDKSFYADVYLGIGAKRSFANDTSTDNFEEDSFTDGYINYNFTGAILKTGIKLGFTF